MGIFQQFPYSNFHEMNLDQIIKIMREMQDEWANTKSEWESYKDFIDNYFENLDVSEEVLDAMRVLAADGTLIQIMDPTIATETAAWLADHITQPTTPIVDTSLTIAGAAADAKVVGDTFSDISQEITEIEDATIIENIDAVTTPLIYVSFTSGYMTNLGEVGASASYQYTNRIPVAPNEIYMSNDPDYALRYVTAFRNNVVVDTEGAIDMIQGYVVPENIDEIVITCYSAATMPNIKKTTLNAVKENNLAEIVNAIKNNTIFADKQTIDITGLQTFRDGYVNTSGQIGNSLTYKRTEHIPVQPGDLFTTTGTTYPFRYVTAYIGDYPETSKSSESVFTYTVPEGVDSVIITIYSACSTSSDTIKITRNNQYSSLFYGALAQKNVGSFEKPYICLSCDDGADELATYTIPMLINKNVPCTFGLYSTSDVFAHAYTSTVLDAVNNHGCAIAQHGMTEWTSLTSEELVEFFDNEKMFWDTQGIDIKGAIYPSHKSNEMIRAITGSRFKACRSGYNYDGTLSYDDGVNNYYGTGARSNMFALSAWNMPAGLDLQFTKDCIDWAIANNKLIIFYWHDWDLTAAQKTVLEAAIDYAIAQGIEFVLLGDIPKLK